MRKINSLLISFVIVTLLILNNVTNAQTYKFIGVKMCAACHKGEKGKKIHEQWLKTKHATAYKTLESQKSKDIAKKMGLTVEPTDAIECLKCHATGYMKGDDRMPSCDKKDGVTCEACHGPGSAYKSKHGKDKKEEGIKNGMIIGTNDEKICKRCHNSESPTFVSFNYKKDWEKVKHY